MTTAQAVIQKVLALPPEKQQQVLEYVQQIECQSSPRRTVRLFDPEGIAAGLGGDLSLEEFQRNRSEMWGSSSDREVQ